MIDPDSALEITPPANLAGKVHAEEPATLHGAVFFGDCRVGAFSYFSHSCEVSDAYVGRYCSIGQGCIIGPGEHPVDFVTTHPVSADPSGVSSGMLTSSVYKAFTMTEVTAHRSHRGRTVIDHDVWLGAHVIVQRGVHIGLGAIVGAGSVVTKDVPPFAIVGGVPARVIRQRLPDALARRLIDSKWWDLDLSKLTVRDYSQPEAFVELLERSDLPEWEPRFRLFEA